MSKTAQRLLIATLFSASGFAITLVWYKFSESKNSELNKDKQIARLVSTLNDVQKKQSQKIIWQAATENEILHVGEAIRTAANAEARIEFLNSATAIDLEPDSAILLEENDGKLSLDFIRGNILVKADAGGDAAASEITLKSGDKKIALGNSEITLGKNKTGGLDVQVLKGSVADLDKLSGGQIKILSPLPGEPLYINPANNEYAAVQWQPLPAGYQVFLESGEKRTELQPLPGALAPGEKGELAANLPLGKSFFRLVARSQDPTQAELRSAVLRTSVLAKIPPLPLTPEKEATVTVNKLNPEVALLWSNPAGFKTVIVEIATSPDLKKKVKTEYLKNVTQLNFTPPSAAIYYWRVSGVLEARKEVVSSPIQHFKLNILNELQPPELELPKNNEKIPFEFIKERGLILSWKPIPGAQFYKVIVEKTNKSGESNRNPTSVEKIFEEQGQFLQANVKNLKPGDYSWAVFSLSDKSEMSKPSQKRVFTLQMLPILPWADGQTQEDFYYLSLKPSLTLKWEKGDPKATNWIVRVDAEDSDVEPVTKKLFTTGTDLNLPRDGRYRAEVEAYDDRGILLARSSKRDVKVAPAPLLPPPQFASEVPDEIEASGGGVARVQWKEVQGAEQYVVLIKSPDGKSNKEYNFKSAEGALKGLMPGEYQLSLRSLDRYGRAGPEGETRKLKVPNQSDVRAPKLKGMKVK